MIALGKIMYQVYIRETIKPGLSDNESGRMTEVKRVRERPDCLNNFAGELFHGN
jgi:hypothetical protein